MSSRWIEWFKDPWRVAVVALATIVVVLLVVMTSNPSTTDSAPTTTTEPQTGTTGAGDEPTTTLGLGDASGTLRTDGLVAVKVDNAPGAQPQVGLIDIPLLIEYPVEGGITRLVAVVNEETTGHIGPVRSLRPVDADLLSIFAPVVASTGGQPFVIAPVEASGVISVIPGALGVFEGDDRPAPHNVFLNLDALFPALGAFEQVPGGLPSGELPAGEPASSIELPIGQIGFEYSEGTYKRLQAGAAVETLDGLQGSSHDVEHNTVIVMHATQRSAGYQDGNGVEVPTFDVIGGGELLVFAGGEVVHGTWLRQGADLPYRFTDDAGTSIGIPGGSIYMAIVPRDGVVTYTP